MITTLLFLAVLSSQSPAEPLYRFVAFGDSRGHNPTDTDMTVQNEIITGMVEAKPTLILQSGDLVYDSSIKPLWDQFDASMKPVWDAHIAYYPSQGNHDNMGVSLYPEFLKNRIMPTWKEVRHSDVPE